MRRAVLPSSSRRVGRLLWACALLVSAAARAQFAASIGVESDNRFRGVSLSDGQPDLRLSLAYDHDSGVFAGASATQVEFMRARRALQLLGYAGVVMRLTPDLSAELGVTSSTFSGNTRYDYTEVFAGLLSERWSLRTYYAADYFGVDQATSYIEFDAHAPLTSRLRLFGHAGALTALRGAAIDDSHRTRTDLRIGLGFAAAPSVDVQLAWVGATRGGPYVVEYGTRRNTVVVGALVSF